MKKDIPQPKHYTLDKLPETLMALVIGMWEKTGGIPKDQERLIFTYFDGIYTNFPLRIDYFIHEQIHFIRQGAGADESLARTWWIKYCEDPIFRLQEELLAYREQYKFLKGMDGGKRFNKPQMFEHAKYFAAELASQKYGNIISESEALMKIIAK